MNLKCPRCNKILKDATHGQLVCIDDDKSVANHIFNRNWVEGYWEGFAKGVKEQAVEADAATQSQYCKYCNSKPCTCGKIEWKRTA